MAIRCRSPPDSCLPASPAGVSQPPFQTSDELLALGGSGGGQDLFVIGLRITQADILFQRAVEEKVVLGYKADLSGQLLQGHLAHICAADLYASPSSRPRDGRSAGPPRGLFLRRKGLPETVKLPSGRLEVDAVEHLVLLLSRIRKGHVLQFYPLPCGVCGAAVFSPAPPCRATPLAS